MKIYMILAFSLFVSSNVAQANSIKNLPALSKWVIHHFKCRAAHLPASGETKEIFFEISAKSSGHGSGDFTLTNGADQIVASANSQMLGAVWTRGGKVVANAQAWVQNSSTKAIVLIVADPSDDGSQVHMNCEAITFDQLAKKVVAP